MEYGEDRAEAIRPEAQLLLCCAKICPDSETDELIGKLLSQSIDWEYLLRMSLSHGVMPLLYRTISAACPEAVPKPFVHQLRSYFYTNAVRSLFITEELLNLLGQLDARGIPAIPFKGPVLAASVYGEPSLRQSCDLDILVKRRDFARVRKLLVSQGYAPLHRMTRMLEATLLQSRCQYALLRDHDRLMVEVHWLIAPPYVSSPLDLDRLWERRQGVSLNGSQVPTLSHEDLLLILCVHGSKHQWERLGWMCDVAKLIATGKRIDWESVMDQARTLRSERMLFLGLFVVSDLLGARLPEGVLQRCQADPVIKRLSARVREQLFQSKTAPRGVLDATLFHLMTKDRLSDRVSYCLRYGWSVLSPTSVEQELLLLPDSLFGFYYIVRPIRLMAKHGARVLKSLRSG